jgi:soluble lytic murein transglycosylase-like protein
MLTILLLLNLNSPPIVEQSVEQVLDADSIAASETILIPFRAEIELAAKAHSLPPALIAAVIQEESRFDQWATRAEPRYYKNGNVRRAAMRWTRAHPGGPTSFTEFADRSRSYGLMQIMGETAREQGFTQPYLAALYIPDNAIEHGAVLMRRLLTRYNNDTLAAISAYNQGSARRNKHGPHRGVFANARYVYRVTIAWRSYKLLFRKGY